MGVGCSVRPGGRIRVEGGRDRWAAECCTWERDPLTGPFLVLRVIPEFPLIFGFPVTLSHVQRGSLCTWEDSTGVEFRDVSA